MGLPELSPAEIETMVYLAAGKTCPETAIILRKSAQTVKAQRMTALVKLGAVNAPQAVAIAMRRGIIK